MPDAGVLGSDWGKLSRFLRLRMQPVDYDGNLIASDKAIEAPLIEGATVGIQGNWQSPFENMGPDSKAPAFTALLQSGALLPLARREAEALEDVGALQGPALGTVTQLGLNSVETLKDLRGRTGITKINSTQIFNGMPPMKLSGSLLFRAWRDPYQEVELPLRKLQSWAVPVKLADQGVILGNLSGDNYNEDILSLKRLLPSAAPPLLKVRWGNQAFPPMVIESYEEPITSPMSADGYYIECVVPITLATLTALDREDLSLIYQKLTDPANAPT